MIKIFFLIIQHFLNPDQFTYRNTRYFTLVQMIFNIKALNKKFEIFPDRESIQFNVNFSTYILLNFKSIRHRPETLQTIIKY